MVTAAQDHRWESTHKNVYITTKIFSAVMVNGRFVFLFLSFCFQTFLCFKTFIEPNESLRPLINNRTCTHVSAGNSGGREVRHPYYTGYLDSRLNPLSRCRVYPFIFILILFALRGFRGCFGPNETLVRLCTYKLWAAEVTHASRACKLQSPNIIPCTFRVDTVTTSPVT
jgi:hypothetical protein